MKPNSDGARRPRQSSRDDLLRVFIEFVADRGYADTSFEDVASEVGVSKGTIVHHFGSKQNMLEIAHLGYMTRRLAEAYLVLEETADVVGQLAAMIHLLLRAHRDDSASTKAFLREFTRFAKSGSAEVLALREEFTSILVGILRRGMASGVFRQSDPKIVALQVFGMCNYAWTWYGAEGSNSIEEIAAVFANTVLDGLVALDPRASTDSERLEAVEAVAADS